MNVYSLKFIPSLKLKFCALFGVASVAAVEQLLGRVDRLEVSMDKFDRRLKQNARKKKVVSQKLALPKLSPEKSVSKPASLQPVSIKENLVEKIETTPKSLVILVQPDDETKKVANEYFGKETDLIEVKQVEEVETRLATDAELQDLTVFFDRGLLAQEKSRSAFERVAKAFPKTRLIGLSSYLTLAVSKSLPQNSDFATFLTKPLSQSSLAEVFERENPALRASL